MVQTQIHRRLLCETSKLVMTDRNWWLVSVAQRVERTEKCQLIWKNSEGAVEQKVAAKKNTGSGPETKGSEDCSRSYSGGPKWSLGL